MRAQDILAETHKLEESGMERSWAEAVAETIANAVEPLATKADLEAESRERRKDFETLRADLKAESEARRKDFETLRSEIKSESRALREELKTESKALREDLKTAMDDKSDANIALLREEMRSANLSLKVWLLVILLGMWGSLSALIVYTQ